MVIDSLEIIYDHNILYAQKIKNWVTYQIIITRLRFQDTIKKTILQEKRFAIYVIK